MRGFDPLQLREDASLNRLVIGDRVAFDVLGLHAVAGADAAHVGAALGLLVATLLDPATADEQSWSEWRRAYLNHWQAIDDVWIGGGLAARFGEAMVHRAQHVVGAAGRRCRIHLAADPAMLSLRGAALDPRVCDGTVAVLDFGQSGVKRAVVRRSSFEVLPTIGVPSSAEDAHAFVADAVVDLVGSDPASDQVSISVATYIVDGRILPSDRSLYGQLGADLPEVLASIIADRCGRDVRVFLSHDGTAAARAIPPSPTAAVIIMGTALASGFPPKC